MEIPYAVHPHPITGVPNGKLGVWLFLASEVMLFGALFSALILLRVGAENWPHGVEAGLSIPLATINTMVLITSSVTMVMSWASLKMNQYGRFQLYLAATILLACVFLVIKYFEYTDKFHHHHYPSTNTFYATYFTMTGLHGLHVVGGIVVNGYLLLTAGRARKRDPDRLANRIEYAGLYWHFVDLVWIFLFPILYLL